MAREHDLIRADLQAVGLRVIPTRVADVGDHVWRFQAVDLDPAEHEHPHPHFVCVMCGGVECLPDVEVPESVSRQAIEVQVRGRCDNGNGWRGRGETGPLARPEIGSAASSLARSALRERRIVLPVRG